LAKLSIGKEITKRTADALKKISDLAQTRLDKLVQDRSLSRIGALLQTLWSFVFFGLLFLLIRHNLHEGQYFASISDVGDFNKLKAFVADDWVVGYFE
jgi:hypothetical protein